MFGNIPTRVPSSFAQDLEDATEKHAYPHHARTTVGHVPVPRYDIQDRFRQDNPNFKGYGIDSTVRQDVGRCPFGTNEDATDDTTQGRTKGRPRGVDFAAQGINTDTFAFGLPSQRPATRGTIPTPSDTCYRTTIEPMSARQRKPHVEPPTAGKTSMSESSVGALLAPGDASNKQHVPQLERPSSRSVRIPIPSFPAGRPTSSRGQDASIGTMQPNQLFQQEKTREQMRMALEKCGPLFHDILRNPTLFEAVWASASTGPAANKISVAAFRRAMESMGV